MKKKSLFRSFIAVVILGLSCTPAYCAELTAEQVMEKVWGQYRSLASEMFEAVINTDSREEKVKQWVQLGSNFSDRITVKFTCPNDKIGTGILTHRSASGDQQWVSTASIGARRASSGDSGKYFGGTNFTNEDIRLLTGENTASYEYRILEKKGTVWVIEATPKPGANSAYSKREIYVSETRPGQFVVKSVSYFRGGTLVKTLENSSFEFFGSAWRPRVMIIKRLDRPSQTEVTIISRKTGGNIEPRVFTPEFLKEK